MHHDVRYVVMGSEPKLRLVTRIDRNRSSVRGGLVCLRGADRLRHV